jgi:hypothetical protein
MLVSLFRAAFIGMAVHFVCTVALRLNIDRDSDLFGQLFTEPILGSITRAPWYLRAKYFFPWVPSPEDLAKSTWFVRVLFWGARLGGTVLLFGLLGGLSSAVYIGVRGQ